MITLDRLNSPRQPEPGARFRWPSSHRTSNGRAETPDCHQKRGRGSVLALHDTTRRGALFLAAELKLVACTVGEFWAATGCQGWRRSITGEPVRHGRGVRATNIAAR